MIVAVIIEGVLLVTAIVLWRLAVRRANMLQRHLEDGGGGRKWRLPTGRETVKAVIETATLVRERGVGGALRTSIEDLAGWAQAERPDLARLAARDGTVSILFSDIEGSTALNEELGDRAWLKVLAKHDKIIRGQSAAQEGHVIKTQGDGFMIAFARPHRGDPVQHRGAASAGRRTSQGNRGAHPSPRRHPQGGRGAPGW